MDTQNTQPVLSKDELLRLLEPENITRETIQRLAYTILYAMGQFYWLKVDGGIAKDTTGQAIQFPLLTTAQTLADEIKGWYGLIEIMHGDTVVSTVRGKNYDTYMEAKGA